MTNEGRIGGDILTHGTCGLAGWGTDPLADTAGTVLVINVGLVLMPEIAKRRPI
jgi:hypothetical protein